MLPTTIIQPGALTWPACCGYAQTTSSGGGGTTIIQTAGIQYLYGESDQPGYVTGATPTLTPAGSVAIFIDNAHNQFMYANGAWS